MDENRSMLTLLRVDTPAFGVCTSYADVHVFHVVASVTNRVCSLLFPCMEFFDMIVARIVVKLKLIESKRIYPLFPNSNRRYCYVFAQLVPPGSPVPVTIRN